MNLKVNTERHSHDLLGIRLIENSVIEGSMIKFDCQNESQSQQVAYINLKYPQFWETYQPNVKGRISVLLNLGPYRFLISQSPTNLSKLFEFLDGESISLSAPSRKRGRGEGPGRSGRMSWSFQKFTNPLLESYSDWIDQGFIYSQADFNFMLTWLVHDLWLFPTEDNAMKPINKQLKKQNLLFTEQDLENWKLKMKLINQEYSRRVRVVNNFNLDSDFNRLAILIEESSPNKQSNWRSGNGDRKERSYNWRTGPDQIKYSVGKSNLVPTKIYPYQGYLNCPKEFRKNRPNLPKNYWCSSTEGRLTSAYQIEKMNQTNDLKIWQTKIKFVNSEYHLKFKDSIIVGDDSLMINHKLYRNGGNNINGRNLDMACQSPIYQIYTGKTVSMLPKLYYYSLSSHQNYFLSKIKKLLDF